MAQIAKEPGPIPNPYVWESPDFAGNIIRISIDYNEGNRSITGGTGFRDAACQYKKIYIGLGPDGTPDTTGHVFNVASGNQNYGRGIFTAAGLDVIEDVLNEQITAGP
jgi:hypothetical protein